MKQVSVLLVPRHQVVLREGQTLAADPRGLGRVVVHLDIPGAPRLACRATMAVPTHIVVGLAKVHGAGRLGDCMRDEGLQRRQAEDRLVVRRALLPVVVADGLVVCQLRQGRELGPRVGCRRCCDGDRERDHGSRKRVRDWLRDLPAKKRSRRNR